MKVLANDGIAASGKEVLEREGFTVVTETVPQENLIDGNQNILIFTEEENYGSANQILEDKGYNLIFENEVHNLASAVNQIAIHLVVFYQVTFSKELVYFLNTIKLFKENP